MKIHSDYRRDQRRRKPPGRGCLLLVTMEQSLFPLETLQEQGMEYFPQPHLLLRAVELCPGQGIYSPPQTYLSWVELEVL